jgi:pyruvate formate lyase activating enzyme
VSSATSPSGAPKSTAEPSGVIFDIMRFSLHDGPGIRTTVFFKGCPLACWWCHNPESQSFQLDRMYYAERCRLCGDCIRACPEHAIARSNGSLVTTEPCRLCGRCTEACQSDARRIVGKRISLSELIAEIEKDVIFFDESGGGVTLSGGEPLLQSRFAAELLRACRERRIHTVLETSGFAEESRFLKISLLADLVLFDLKVLDASKHEMYTGVPLAPILGNLEALAARGRMPVVRIPVVPGINDGDDDLRQFASYLRRIRVQQVHLLPYHRTGIEKYQRLGLTYRLPHTPAASVADLERFAAALMPAGCSVVIGG